MPQVLLLISLINLVSFWHTFWYHVWNHSENIWETIILIYSCNDDGAWCQINPPNIIKSFLFIKFSRCSERVCFKTWLMIKKIKYFFFFFSEFIQLNYPLKRFLKFLGNKSITLERGWLIKCRSCCVMTDVTYQKPESHGTSRWHIKGSLLVDESNGETCWFFTELN